MSRVLCLVCLFALIGCKSSEPAIEFSDEQKARMKELKEMAQDFKVHEASRQFGVLGLASLLLFQDQSFKSSLGIAAPHSDEEAALISSSIGREFHSEHKISEVAMGETVYAAILFSPPVEAERKLGDLKINFIVRAPSGKLFEYGEEAGYDRGTFQAGHSGLLPIFIGWKAEPNIDEKGEYSVIAKIREVGGPLSFSLSEVF
ncbi:MAG: hypothetical protein KDD60_06290, partial [Bdellovibrionales bacterium]|nr:hypothetical protein [Bdellovibrionales bacterium]